jgi:hypothetical protein
MPKFLDINFGNDISMTDELKFAEIVVEAPDVVAAADAVVEVKVVESKSLIPEHMPAPMSMPDVTTRALVVRMFVGFSLALVNNVFFLASGAAWLFAFRKLFLFYHAAGGLKGDAQLFQAIWMTPLVSSSYWGEGLLTVILLSLSWTTLHLVRNKPLGWMRWPFLLLVWVGSLCWFPAGNCAYALVFCFPDAMFSALELYRRAVDFVVQKLVGHVDINLKPVDSGSAIWISFILAFSPMWVMMSLSMPIVGATAFASLVLQGLHMYWNRRITKCIEDESATDWRSIGVMMVTDSKNPRIELELANRNETFIVRHGNSMPLEVMQFELRKKRIATIGFDKISGRPIAIKLGGLVFPLTKSALLLP